LRLVALAQPRQIGIPLQNAAAYLTAFMRNLALWINSPQ
jgi:hypothetical protein